jgi:hypothetical protein
MNTHKYHLGDITLKAGVEHEVISIVWQKRHITFAYGITNGSKGSVIDTQAHYHKFLLADDSYDIIEWDTNKRFLKCAVQFVEEDRLSIIRTGIAAYIEQHERIIREEIGL